LAASHLAETDRMAEVVAVVPVGAGVVTAAATHGATDVVFVDDVSLGDVMPEPLGALDGSGRGVYLRVTATTALLGLRDVREIGGMPYVAIRSRALRPHQVRLKRLVELAILLVSTPVVVPVLAIAAASPALWEKFCVLLGRDGWLADDRFVNNGSRMLHADELEAEVEAVLATDSTDAWLERLRIGGIPAGPINTVREAFREAAALGLDPVDVLDDGAGEFRSVRSPIRMSATPPTVRRRPPTNDQHGAEIRAELDS